MTERKENASIFLHTNININYIFVMSTVTNIIS